MIGHTQNGEDDGDESQRGLYININKYATYLIRLSKTSRFRRIVDEIGNDG